MAYERNTLASNEMLIANQTVENIDIPNGDVTKMRISEAGVANYTTIREGGVMYISSGGKANNTDITNGGSMHIFNGGEASDTAVSSGGSMHISSGGVASGSIVSSGGIMSISSSGVANSVIVKDTGIMKISSGGMLKGSLEIQSGGEVSAEAGAVIDFTVAECETDDDYLINDLSLITGTPDYTITVSADQSDGTYNLAQGAANFTGTISIGDGTIQYGLLTVNGGDWVYNNNIYSFEQADGNLTLTIKDYVPGTPIVTNTPEIANPVAHSIDFSNATDLTLTWEEKSVNISNLNGVTVYAPRTGVEYSVQANGETSSGKAQVVAGDNIQSVLVQAETDGTLDLFMANATDVWSNEYVAKHTGTKGIWAGTGETVELVGKNKITDFFYGAEDDNILYLTDDEYGDALFVDDIYSAIPGKNLENTSRIENLKVIYAGSGDDVVDMTSQRFDYTDSGVTVYGGDGNDVIWANSGENTLFGDAGNDRIVGASGNDWIIGGSGDDYMHGGGGSDTFCFGGDWGNDTVEQLDGGTVTLWFNVAESEVSRTGNVFTFGENSVTVSGVTADKITLKFGGIEDAPEGAFAEFAS